MEATNTTRPEEVTEMVTHIDTCNAGEQYECHNGPDRCRACDEDMQVQYEAEAYAEFGMGSVTSGGDPADVSAAWSQEKALAAERDEAERNQRIEDEVASGLYRSHREG